MKIGTNSKVILMSLATYVVATVVLLGSASALGMLPRNGIDGRDGLDGKPGLDGKDGVDGEGATLKTYVVTNDGLERRALPVSVSCKSGDTLIGGGANTGTGYGYLVASFPYKNSWIAVGEGPTYTSRFGRTIVYAICQDNP